MRYACLFVPDFPLAARIRVEPALARAAAVVLDGPANAPYVGAATLEAQASGVRAGQSLPQARALLPDVQVRRRDPLAERSATQALRDAAEASSPAVESGGPGVVFLDAGGVAAEGHFAEEVSRRSRELGLDGRVGLADSRSTALIAARASQGAPVVVPPGRAAEFLAPRPLSCLRPSPELRERLERWGLKTAGAFARIPGGEISARLGPQGLALHRAARGLDERDFVPEPHPALFFEGASFEWPIAELEPFSLAAGELLERLAERLRYRGLACRKLEVTLELDPQGRDTRALALAAPTREAKTWLGLLKLDLERRPPGAPVAGLSAAAVPEESRSVQLTLFGPPAPSPDKLSTTLARLSATLGPDRVGVPVTSDTHRPESFGLGEVPLAPPAGGQAAGGLSPCPREAHLVVRVLRPRVTLTVRADASGRPAWLRAAEAPFGPFEGTVRVASGPWRLEDGWWTEDAVRRDYWDVELSDGGLYRIFRDAGGWFADGIYD